MRLKNLLATTALLLFSATAFSQWYELGTGTNSLKSLSSIYSIYVDGNGNVLAHGGFYDSSTTPATTYALAKWNGSSWSKHSGIQPYRVYLSNRNNLYCSVPTDPGVNGVHNEWNVLKWNGAKWDTLGAPNNKLNATDPIPLMYELKNGNLILSGNFRGYIPMWTGSAWDTLDKGTSHPNMMLTSSVLAFADDNLGNIYAIGGQFHDTAGSPYPYAYHYVAKFNGTGWSKAGTGANGGLYANGSIFAIACDNANNLYAAGDFYDTAQFHDQTRYVAKWNGTIWSQLGQGANSPNAHGPIHNIAVDSKSNVYASGLFYTPTGTYVARWDGTNWSNFGNHTFDGEVYSLVVDRADNVYATGSIKNSSQKYYVAKYGTATTGVFRSKSGVDFSVYPNPTQGYINIEGPEGATAVLINAFGQRIMSNSLNTRKHVMDVSSLPTGMYILQITDAKGNRNATSIFKQ